KQGERFERSGNRFALRETRHNKKTSEGKMADTFDYVIVGAGSAGCVLNSRLSEDAGTSVCVLEAGPRDWHPYIHLPSGFIKTFHQPGLNWLYTMEPSEWTGGRRILAPRGKARGGSSSNHGHPYNRRQAPDHAG